MTDIRARSYLPCRLTYRIQYRGQLRYKWNNYHSYIEYNDIINREGYLIPMNDVLTVYCPSFIYLQLFRKKKDVFFLQGN